MTRFAFDASWEEGKHPRDGGKFTSGSGGSQELHKNMSDFHNKETEKATGEGRSDDMRAHAQAFAAHVKAGAAHRDGHPDAESKSEAAFEASRSTMKTEKTKTSVSALKAKLEGMPHDKLMSALKSKDVDPQIKKHIEAELDGRANRGTSRGVGEK